MEFYK